MQSVVVSALATAFDNMVMVGAGLGERSTVEIVGIALHDGVVERVGLVVLHWDDGKAQFGYGTVAFVAILQNHIHERVVLIGLVIGQRKVRAFKGVGSSPTNGVVRHLSV